MYLATALRRRAKTELVIVVRVDGLKRHNIYNGVKYIQQYDSTRLTRQSLRTILVYKRIENVRHVDSYRLYRRVSTTVVDVREYHFCVCRRYVIINDCVVKGKINNSIYACTFGLIICRSSYAECLLFS